MSSITLDAAVIGSLRHALYSQVGMGIDEIDAVLVLSERERNPRVHDAYRALRATGDVLDRIGWVEQDSKDTLTVSESSEARLILYALEVEWGVQAEQIETARSFGEDQRVAAVEKQCLAVRDAACVVEAVGLAAGLLDKDARDA